MTIDTDLFGEAITPMDLPPALGEKKRRKTVPKGYAGPPGTGPKGETCKTCKHYARTGGHARIYRKCALAKAKWTHGPGSDILAKAPACRYWEARA